MEQEDPYRGYDSDSSILWGPLVDTLKREHGWEELRAYQSKDAWEAVGIKDFILRGVPRFVLDAVELFYDQLAQEKEKVRRSGAQPERYSQALNTIFEDGNLPWRMLQGRITRVDSKWIEAEIHAKASELLGLEGFDGALAEFQEARSALSSGDTKGAIHAANLALESCMKCILGVDQEKPGKLIRMVIDSGLVPEYHADFLEAFGEHILRSVPDARNWEKGVGHGQGVSINDPPRSLAELAVNLGGVLIVFLIKRHIEGKPTPPANPAEPEEEPLADDIPF
jgi:hypothetical protein